MIPDEILLEQYRIYSEQKEKFVDRSFLTNKFYLVLVLALIVVMFYTKDYSFVYGLSSTLILGAAGAAICSLWWINVDSYNFIIKVKLSKVLEEMEKRLPFQPNAQEFAAIRDLRKNKREFVFADVQKTLALLFFLLFFFLFLYDLVALFYA